VSGPAGVQAAAPGEWSAPAAVAEAGEWRQSWRQFLESRRAVVALWVLAVLLVAAVFAPVIAPQDPYDLTAISFYEGRLPPGETGASGFVYLLGSDVQGRDMFSAMLYGLRTSLLVGVLSAVFAIGLGVSLGLVAAYAGGWADALIMRVVDFMLGFPTILVALILLAVLGQGIDKVILALVIVQWAYFARAVRGVALVERSREYVEAALCLRLGSARILFRHILPNCLPPVIVIGTMQIASAISLEATLSFLGLGLPITEPSLGLLIANGFNYLMSGLYWISVFPGLLLLVAIFSLNVVGDRLRDVLNPRLQR
jgi:peptide/nickel transport system permease protein